LVLLLDSICQQFAFFGNGYLFCVLFVAKNNAVQQIGEVVFNLDHSVEFVTVV